MSQDAINSRSLSLRLVTATTLVFLASFAGAFAVLVQETQYGLFRIQRDSLTVQVGTLSDRLRIVNGEPSLDFGTLAGDAARTVSYAVLDPDGRVLRSLGHDGIDISPETLRRYDRDDPFGFSIERWFAPDSGDPVTLILPDLEGRQRIVVTAGAAGGYLVQASMSLIDNKITVADVIYNFTEATALALLLPLALAMIAIPIIVHLTLKPIRRLSRQAADMNAATLDRRLSLHRVPSEVRGLVIAFNDLLARLDQSWRLQRDFTANAAHELRTPIAALRAQVEAAVPANVRPVLAIQFDKVARLLTQLLALAEADSRPIDAMRQFNLLDIAQEVVADMAPAIVSAGKEISIDGDGQKTSAVWGDRGLAGIALRNLVDNALRHSAKNSVIRVTVSGASITVANTGSYISPETKAGMFERFWKQDRRTSGSGLGLSIVETIVKRLGGAVTVAMENDTISFSLTFRPASDSPRVA